MEEWLARGGRAKMLAAARRWLFAGEFAVEDAVQEAMLAAYRSRHNYTPGNFDAWIITITKRTAMALAKRPAYQILSKDSVDECGREIVEEIAATHDNPVIDSEPEQSLARVEKLLRAVVPGTDGALFFEVFIKRDGSNEARAEVMDAFGLSDEALRQRLHRARERFIEAVGFCDVETRKRFETGRASLEDWEALVRSSQDSMPAEQGMGLALSSMAAFVKAHQAKKMRRDATPIRSPQERLFK
jgi:RNA polymerase sigma factor (sigma-70 family)